METIGSYWCVPRIRAGEMRCLSLARHQPERERSSFVDRLAKADKDGDGKLTKDELPESMQGSFSRLDANSDGSIDQEGLAAMRDRSKRGGRGGEGRGPTGVGSMGGSWGDPTVYGAAAAGGAFFIRTGTRLYCLRQTAAVAAKPAEQGASAMGGDDQVNVNLGVVQETLLIPLWARAVEAGRSEPILRDTKAVEMVDAIDYDFDKFGKGKGSQVGCCLRASILDDWVREFLWEHPDGTVVEIGSGLGTRFERLDNGEVRWFELDLSDVIAIRRRFFEETERRRFISRSVLTTEWLPVVEESGSGPFLFVAEGVFMYFEEQQVKYLLAMLADHFPGSQIAFDAMSPLMVRMQKRHDTINETSAKFRWGLSDIKDLEGWDPRYGLAAELKPGFYTIYKDGDKKKHHMGPKTGLKNEEMSLHYCQQGKAIVNSGKVTDSFRQPVGHKLEIIPLKNPALLREGDTLPLKVLFDGEPVPGYPKLLATYLGFSTTGAFAYAKSVVRGQSEVKISMTGVWYVNAKYQTRPTGDLVDKCDEVSYTATLTFEVGRLPTAKTRKTRQCPCPGMSSGETAGGRFLRSLDSLPDAALERGYARIWHMIVKRWIVLLLFLALDSGAAGSELRGAIW